IRIEADDDFAAKVTAVVEDSVLKLDIDSKRMWLKPREKKIKVFVHAHHLRLVRMNQSSFLGTTNAITTPEFGIIMQGKVQEADLELNCPTFYCWNVHPCGGQLRLRGTVQNLKIWSVALLGVQAENLTTSYALIDQESKADCRVHVTNQLEYGISGAGNILLSGHPPIISQTELNSTGRLIEVD
ncbi:MAG: GIN domain-containing protein, partial [Bacteroidia bacterium]